MTDIYDWRSTIRPYAEFYNPGGQTDQGGLTLGGFRFEQPEPGGRGALRMQFPHFHDPQSETDASWTIARIRNGAVMRIRMSATSQLVSAEDLGGSDDGLPWSGGLLWANGEPWEWSPRALVSTDALRGAVQFSADLSDFGRVVRIGHVIGLQSGNLDFAHEVMDVSYDEADVATFTVSPPLRRAVTAGDDLLFRPRIMAVCRNPGSAFGGMEVGQYIKIGDLEFEEALL
jgi:hypothetical protein